MSISFDTNTKLIEFDREAKQSFQTMDLGLENYVDVIRMEGQTKKMYNVGETIVLDHVNSYGEIPAQSPTVTVPEVTATPRSASVYISELEQRMSSVEERASIIQSLQYATQRKIGQIVMGAMAAATKTIAHASTSFTIEKLIAIEDYFGSEVPVEGRYVIVHDKAFNIFRQEDEVKNIQISTEKFLATNRRVIPYSTMTVMPIATQDALASGDGAGYPKLASTTRTSFAWQKSAVVLGINMEPTFKIMEVRPFVYQVAVAFQMGAVIRQQAGVCKVENTES
jgi:hypothetical protein